MPTRSAALAGGLLVSLPLLLSSTSAQEPLPWQRGNERYQQRDDGYRQNSRVPRTEEEEEEAPAANAPGRRTPILAAGSPMRRATARRGRHRTIPMRRAPAA